MQKNGKKSLFEVTFGDGLRVQCLSIEPYIYILR